MESAQMTQQRRRQHRQHLSARDNALVQAKVAGVKVALVLAVETDYTDNSGNCKAEVMHVDGDSIKFKIEGREIWIGKSFIVSAEPLGAHQ